MQSTKAGRLGAVEAILGEVVMLPMLSEPLIKHTERCRSISSVLNTREKESARWKSLFVNVHSENSERRLRTTKMNDLITSQNITKILRLLGTKASSAALLRLWTRRRNFEFRLDLLSAPMSVWGRGGEIVRFEPCQLPLVA